MLLNYFIISSNGSKFNPKHNENTVINYCEIVLFIKNKITFRDYEGFCYFIRFSLNNLFFQRKSDYEMNIELNENNLKIGITNALGNLELTPQTYIV